MRILIAVDVWTNEEGTLRLGASIARRAGHPPMVLTVIRQEVDRAAAEAVLARARTQLEPDAPQVCTRVCVGDPCGEIVREAQAGGYDLVIVGQRRARNPLSRFLSGSDALCVVKRAPCPVLVVKGRTGPIRHLLMCDSGARSPSILGGFTAQLASLLEGDKEITILHVMSQMSAAPGIRGTQLRASAEELIAAHTLEGELLERDMEVFKQVGIEPSAKVRHGLVLDEILEEVQTGDYDLVVIGAHRTEAWQRILLDDLCQKTLAHVDRPVLVVR